MMQNRGRPWFDGPFEGAGLSLPVAWQGWAVLSAFVAGSVGCAVMLHGEAQGLTQVALFIATMALIRLKRA